MNILVTGAAGFIGFHLCRALLAAGHRVTGIDTLNDYYSPELKKDRLAILCKDGDFTFHRTDLADVAALRELFEAEGFTHVVNLAAQAGVRYSLVNPDSYVQTNLVGFFNLLECCRACPVEHQGFASSSSMYGLKSHLPFSTRDHSDHPVRLYSATKKSGEAMAHS